MVIWEKECIYVWLGHLLYSRNWQNIVNYNLKIQEKKRKMKEISPQQPPSPSLLILSAHMAFWPLVYPRFSSSLPPIPRPLPGLLPSLKALLEAERWGHWSPSWGLLLSTTSPDLVFQGTQKFQIYVRISSFLKVGNKSENIFNTMKEKKSASQTWLQASNLWPASVTLSLWINIVTHVCRSPLDPQPLSYVPHSQSVTSGRFHLECPERLSWHANSKLNSSFPPEKPLFFQTPLRRQNLGSLPCIEIQNLMH